MGLVRSVPLGVGRTTSWMARLRRVLNKWSPERSLDKRPVAEQVADDNLPAAYNNVRGVAFTEMYS